MTPFVAELVGTTVLLLLGDGVVANVVLDKTKGQNSGWLVITAGWGVAVFVGVMVSSQFSGGHLNPAVTIGLAVAGKFPWSDVGPYLVAQFLGAALGAALMWLHYRSHFEQTSDSGAKLAAFCPGPAIRNPFENFIGEVIGTAVLVMAALYMVDPEHGIGGIAALPIGLVVLGIGLSLGGTTGYAINPARDLSPRLMHAVLPITGKGGSDLGYAVITVFGPVAGGVVAAMLYRLL